MKKSSTRESDFLNPSNILYEDNHIIVLNKQPSQIVQGDKTGDITLADLVKDYLKVKYGKTGEVFLGVVHRLDRPVSGAIIFARTSKALTRLNEQLKKREISKTYWAIVKNQPAEESGLLKGNIVRNETQNKSYILNHPTNKSQEALLSYKLIKRSKTFYLLEIDLHTGRHHQIRAQLSHIGCPIKGDLKYGFDRSNPDGSISLHARKIRFIHPVSKAEIIITAPLPKDPTWEYFE